MKIIIRGVKPFLNYERDWKCRDCKTVIRLDARYSHDDRNLVLSFRESDGGRFDNSSITCWCPVCEGVSRFYVTYQTEGVGYLDIVDMESIPARYGGRLQDSDLDDG